MIRALALPVALLLAAAFPAVAAAETYEIDLIVFLQGGADGEAPLPPLTVDTSHALDPENVEGLHALGIHVLPDGAGILSNLRHSLQLSGKRYEVLEALSWIQSDPPATRGPVMHITGGGIIDTANGPLRALDGTVSLHGGFYLHVDADLVWTQHEQDGSTASWHLEENRRLKLNETHYLDNARFGAITRVTRKS